MNKSIPSAPVRGNRLNNFPQGRSLRPAVLISVLLAGRIFFTPPVAGAERTHSGHDAGFISQLVPEPQNIAIPTFDISGETDRHQHCYAPDGRLVVVGRDNAIKSPTRRHFVAWVGTYEDIATGKEGSYRVKLLHSNKGNVEYPSLEVLPDGTFVAVNSVTYRPEKNYSLVSTRFTLDELDQKFRELKK